MAAITVGSRTFQTMDDLEKLVIHAATEYELNGYVEDFDDAEITDPEYDALFKELKKLKPDSVAFKGTSPSTAADAATGDVVVHDPPMTSIAKADGTLVEKQAIFDRWLADCTGRLGGKEPKVAISYKRDGVAARFNYDKGKLVSAGLRPRDGINGTDITRHCKYLDGVPKKLPLPLTLSLSGEVECWFEDFKKVNAERDAAGEDLYKNPRNFTAGCLGRDDPEENKNSRLRVTFHNVTGFDEWEKYYTTEVERAKWVNTKVGLNLQTAEGKGRFVHTRPFDPDYLQKMEDYASKLPYYTDGIVLKVNDLEDQAELGHTGDDPVNTPRGALAWKYKEPTAEAIVSSIEWKASRTGRVVPTAVFDIPFTLADTDNSRATCNNYGWMESQGLGPGATVKCKKGGKIIPNIMKVLKPVKDIGAPTDCPSCGDTLHLHTSSSGNKDLQCQNKDCPAKHTKRWIHYIQNIGGKGLGLSAMEKILNSGEVKSLADLYTLSIGKLQPHGFSTRQALLAMACVWKVKPGKTDDDVELLKKIKKAQGKKQKIPGWHFFAALGIPGAGKTAGKALIAHFKDFDDIRAASTDELAEVAGIGDTTAEAIHSFFDQEGYNLVDDLLDFVELDMPKTGKLSGTNFVLTGDFDEGKKHWEVQIEALGGNIQSGVRSNTNYLVQQHGKSDGSPSAKEKKAADLGTPIISVKQLEKIL